MFKPAYSLLATAMVMALLHPTSARADRDPVATAILVDGAVVLPGIALCVPNIIHVFEGRRPPVAWPITGLVLGIVGAGLNALVLSEVSRRDELVPVISGLAGSAITVSFALWAWLLPTKRPLVAASNGMSISSLCIQRARAGGTYSLSIAAIF